MGSKLWRKCWHFQKSEDVEAFLDAMMGHDTSERLPQLKMPTLVLAGGIDLTSRPELCCDVAERIPGAIFEVLEGEGHQPFQEVPEQWNARVSAFWESAEAGDKA